MVCAEDFGGADTAAAHNAFPLTVVAADESVIPCENDVAALVAPLPEYVRVAFGQGDGNDVATDFFIDPGAKGEEDIAFDFVEYGAGFGVDPDVESLVVFEVGAGFFKVDFSFEDFIALDAVAGVFFQDGESAVVQEFSDVGDTHIWRCTVIGKYADISGVIGGIPHAF